WPRTPPPDAPEDVSRRGSHARMVAGQDPRRMRPSPSFDEIFGVMSAASVGNLRARVVLPPKPDVEDIPTRFALSLNILLDDLAFRMDEVAATSADRKRAEDRYRALFESSPLPMWVFDRSTRHFLAVNEAAIQHYG